MKKQEEAWLLSEKYGGEKSDLSACDLTPAQAEAFFADCARLAAGEPLGYVIGFVPFLDCKIWLDSKPLIPRPETEYWTEKAIQEIKRVTPTASRILDLCAGSGAIGIAVAKAVGEADVTFGEIDKAHLATIGKNLTENHIDCTRYKVFQSDLFKNIDGQFDYILTNPPYINKEAGTVEISRRSHLHRLLPTLKV